MVKLVAEDKATMVGIYEKLKALLAGLVQISCGEEEFRCDDGQKCIDDRYECNGVKYCDDGSDEKDCRVYRN